MKKKYSRTGIWMIPVLLVLGSCAKSGDLAEMPGPAIPAHFPPPVYRAESNTYTAAGIELGKKLFFDPGLSATGKVSCATCHDQVHSFSDHNVPLSRGIFGKLGKRNSPPIYNLIWTKNFMWDGSIRHIELQPIAPLTDSAEMGASIADIVKYLRSNEDYRKRFASAFNGAAPDDQKMLKAMAQYMATLVSANSKYDRVITGRESFTEQEARGYAIFKTNCKSCHTEPLLTDGSYRNNGLDVFPADSGRMRITRNPADRGKFRVPSLRNVALTYPYMHDGRFDELKTVVDHYSAGMHSGGLTDPSLAPMNFTPQQKADLISFLSALTDYEFVSNIKHAYR